MRIWQKDKKICGVKFLVVRRDGTVPSWSWFVLGARDPAAPAALRAYVDEAAKLGLDEEYCQSIRELADDFEAERTHAGSGDPDASPHRQDNVNVINAMLGRNSVIVVKPDRQREVES